MKKKFRLIIIMLALCVSVLFGVKYYQSNTNESENNKKTDIVLQNAQTKKQEENKQNPIKAQNTAEEKKEDKKAITESKDNIKNQAKESEKNKVSNTDKQKNSNTVVKQETKKETSYKKTVENKETENKEVQQVKNVLIKDEVSGKVIGNIYCNLDNKNAAEATIEALNKIGVRYRAVGSGETIYFSSINGIKERSQGPLSGWCYYVNGSKPSVGAGSYKLKKGDKLQWVFKKDGVN